MKTDELDYILPPELIARHPAQRRDQARMLRVNRRANAISHHNFSEFPELLTPGDLVILNDTRVFPARLTGVRPPHGGHVEALLLEQHDATVWTAMVRPARRIRPGDRIVFEPGRLEAVVEPEPSEGSERRLRFEFEGDWWRILDAIGHTPLPPYIVKARRDDAEPEPAENDDDRRRYQTVYAGPEPGSVAAPTAGLHFTPETLEALRQRDIRTAAVRLHVGAGTFQPIREETVESHPIHSEHVCVPPETAEAINLAKREDRRVVAIGTTSVRAIETAALVGRASWQDTHDAFQPDTTIHTEQTDGPVVPIRGWTRLLITPGFPFGATDALLTNFHLPRSSLLALVAALADIQTIRRAYDQAIENKYRFYSYGDCMLIE